jgi:hypothetical protein
LPAVSVIENDPEAARDELTEPPPEVAVEVALTVQTIGDVWTIEVIEEIPVVTKSLEVNVVQSIASLPATVNEIFAEFDVADDLARVSVGGVESAIVTLTEAGEPATAVCALPAVSATEKLEALVSVELTDAPPAVAVDVAVIVQTVEDV